MRILLWGVLVLIGLVGCGTNERFGDTARCMEVNPVNGRVEVAKNLDTNHDGDLEEVVVYTDDGDIFLQIFQDETDAFCHSIFNVELDTLNLLDRRMGLVVTDVELIDVTNDDLPEIHIGFETSGGGRYASAAVHHLYHWNGDTWERIYISRACLPFSTFEMVENPNSKTTQIFYQNDLICDTADGRRDYVLYEWDGEKFQVVETGIREIPIWQKPFEIVLCLCCLFPFILAGLVIWFFARNKQDLAENPVSHL
jgi:hypothetical protein